MKINKDDIKKRIIYRASYRGTKEMDVLMSSFVKSIINKLNEEELLELEKFVNLSDEDLIKLNKNFSNVKEQIFPLIRVGWGVKGGSCMYFYLKNRYILELLILYKKKITF